MNKEKCKTPCLCETCLTARDEEIQRVKDGIKEAFASEEDIVFPEDPAEANICESCQ